MSKTIDLTSLPGWAALPYGNHEITVKAKASGYRDSKASAGVSVVKSPPPPGLYDANDNLLVSWANSGISKGCTNAKTVLSNYPTCTKIYIDSSISYVGDNAFSGCSALTDVYIPSSVTSIGYQSFYNCTGLINLTVPDTCLYFSSGAFYNCRSLIDINIPEGTEQLPMYMLSGCTSLTKVTVPSSVTRVREYAFSASGLTSITMPSSVTWIGEGVCSGCTGLTDVFWNDRLFPISAFQGCNSLTSIAVPEGHTIVSKRTFYYCKNLTSIYLPSTLDWTTYMSLGQECFMLCSALQDIYYNETKEHWQLLTARSGSNWNAGTGNYTVHCTDGDLPKT